MSTCSLSLEMRFDMESARERITHIVEYGFGWSVAGRLGRVFDPVSRRALENRHLHAQITEDLREV